MMKKNLRADYQAKDIAALQKDAAALDAQVLQHQIAHSTGTLKDTSVIKKTKAALAFVKMLITQKQHDR